WRCTGPCKDRQPFFGWVKRAMNRAPSANDLWWTTHQASCSGEFVKVKEPEKKKRQRKQTGTEATQPKIGIFFPGKGYVLGNEAVTTSAFMEEERRNERPEGPSNSQSTSTVDNEAEKPVATKRKRRTKEEIEQEKLNKEVNKVCRQIQSAKNTKCEQYLFCHFSSKILCLNDNLAEELGKRFEERGITEQIVYDKSHNNLMQVFWLKKRLEAFLEDGKLHKSERMELQNVFCCVLSGETYSVLVKSRGNSMMDYLDEQMAAVRQKISGDPQLTVVVFGTHHVRENTVSSLIFEAFEKHRIQFRFVSDAFDFSFLIAQYHRALAKVEKKAEKQIAVEQSDSTNGTHFVSEKGIADGPSMVSEALAKVEKKAEKQIASDSTNGTHFVAEKGIADGPSMVSDWWEKMLEHLHRMSEEQKRAIMEAHPNPYKLMEWLLEPENTAGQAMFALSEIQMESGRRLGPVLAQKIYKMLTSRTGTESTE
uniref:Crossover junction endonuclease MUS81 n=1 Tax=Globodera pallida TaxID=36090 RepID=A0A183CPY2_GLOPA